MEEKVPTGVATISFGMGVDKATMSGEFWFLSDSAIRALAQAGRPPGALPGGPGLCVPSRARGRGGSGEWRPPGQRPWYIVQMLTVLVWSAAWRQKWPTLRLTL